MIIYDKDKIKEAITLDNIFQILTDFGAEPEITKFGIIGRTICHNDPSLVQGSKKMYYYKNSGLFYCYTNCGSFDIFNLIIKVAKLQWHKEYSLYDAILWIVNKFGFFGQVMEDSDDLNVLPDWEKFEEYDKTKSIELPETNIKLNSYDALSLSNFNYNIKIKPWLDEHIEQKVLNKAKIGFYPGGNQITIPHFDKDGDLIGIRGRTLSLEDAEKYGKYRPLIVGKSQFNHPLGLNLYNLNNSKNNIRIMKKAIVFEGKRQSRPNPLFH